jgi:preprotein translocase subunit SecE
MAKSSGIVPTGMRRVPPGTVAPAGAAAVAEPKRQLNPVQFLREVRAEARKVTWTSWKETWITSVMVGIMVVMTALFFFGVDAVLHAAVTAMLKLANAE